MSRINTLTNTYLLPKVCDTVLRENPLTAKILSAPTKWRGEQIRKAVKVVKNTNGTSFAGFQTLPTQAVNTRQYIQFPAKFYQIDVTVPLTDMAINLTDDERILDLAEAEMTSSAEDMADDIGNILYKDGTGNGSLDFNGLLNIVDDGTNAATYGGLTRATYTTLNSTVTAATTLSLSTMATLYNAIADGTVIPDLAITDRVSYAYYEQLIVPTNRIYITVPEAKSEFGGKGLAGTAGYTTLSYKGIGILPDRKCTTGYLHFLREEDLEFQAIEKMPNMEPVQFVEKDFEDNVYTNVKGLGFHWTGWVKPVNQLAYVGRVVIGGEFWSKNPRRHGKLTGIAGI